MSAPDRERRMRREPPPLRRVVVDRLAPLSPHMMRVTVAGEELAGFPAPKPAASVRLLLPPAGTKELVMPAWNGNEFVLPDGSRAPIRTFTPRRFDPAVPELDLDIVLHEGGAAPAWVQAADPGDPVAVSGPGRGYDVDPAAREFFLAGDETALPAIGQLVEAIDGTVPIRVVVETAHPAARIDLPDHPRLTVDWVEAPAGAPPGTALVGAVTSAGISPATKVWVAGEAGSLVPIREHLLEGLGRNRSDVTIRGYWKHGR